jgi:hypothetical protein
LSGTLAAKVSISAAVFIILRHLATIVLLSTYKTLPSVSGFTVDFPSNRSQ